MKHRVLPDIPTTIKGPYRDATIQIVDPEIVGEFSPEILCDAITEPNVTADLVVRISNDKDSRHQWQLFFHELLHVLEHQYNFSVTEEEETSASSSVYDQISAGLYNAFIINEWKLPGE